MSTASCSRSTRGWGVGARLLKALRFFQKRRVAPTTASRYPHRHNPHSVALPSRGFRLSPSLQSVRSRRDSLVSVYLRLSSSPAPCLSLSPDRLVPPPFSAMTFYAPLSAPLPRCMPLALFPPRSPASPASLASAAPTRLHQPLEPRPYASGSQSFPIPIEFP